MSNKNNSVKMNKWCILLTMAIDVNNEINYRSKIYLEQIEKWINNTNYFIFIVESTGHSFIFNEIKNKYNNRIYLISLNLIKNSSSSILEAKSIEYAMNIILNTNIGQNVTHILKVTGRYYLNNIQEILQNIFQDIDIYIQIHTDHNIKWQNTEYYGIRKELLIPMVENVIKYSYYMEHNFYDFIFINNNFEITNLGPFFNKIPRGGDGLIIPNL